MSRWLEYDPKTKNFKENIECMDRCKNMYDEVCCCLKCEWAGDFPGEEYCNEQCPFFEKEDGIICENPEV